MKKKICKDAELASIMDSTKQLQKPTFLCPSGHKVSEMCCNKNCISSLHCNDYGCEYCSEKHLCCGLSSRSLSKISYIFNRLSKYRRDVLESMERIDRKVKETLTESLQQFIEEYPETCLEDEKQHIYEKIYTKTKGENITGAQAEEFCFEMDQKLNNYQTIVPKSLKWYEDKMNEISEHAKNLKKQLRVNFTKEMIKQKGFDDKKLLKGFEQKKEQKEIGQKREEKEEILKKESNNNGKNKNIKKINSVILKYPSNNEKIEFLIKSLTDIKPIKSMQLLFRGSNDGFKASAFHQKCDNISDTVVIVKTDSKTNNIVAGYSHYQWNKPNDEKSVRDAQKKTFLLQLNRLEKYVPKDENYLIRCNNSFGPVFGGGYDLYISDDCNSNFNSFSNFPFTYNLEGQNKIQKSQQSYTNFSGATDGYNFRVIDYEVFRVIFIK